MHYKTKIILSGGAVILLMMVSFVMGMSVMNPYIFLFVYENQETLMVLAITPVIVGMIMSIWQHRFFPFFVATILTIVIPTFVFCGIVIYYIF